MTAGPPPLGAGSGGIVLILSTMLLFVSMDTLVKELVQRYPAPQLIWMRFLVNMAMAAVIVLGVPRNRRFVRSVRPGRQFLRSALLMTTTTTFFFGLRYLPVADMVILTQAAPLLVVIFAVLMLGERAGPRRWLGVAIGFVGVVIVLKPGFGFVWASLFGLASAVIYAIYQVMTRSLSAADHPTTTFFYTATAGTLLAAPFGLALWQTPTLPDALLICLPGLIGGAGHLLLIVAFSRSEASLLAPFFYSSIVWGTIFGWIFFGDIPDAATVAGAILIVGAGLYVWHRERKIAAARLR